METNSGDFIVIYAYRQGSCFVTLHLSIYLSLEKFLEVTMIIVSILSRCEIGILLVLQCETRIFSVGQP